MSRIDFSKFKSIFDQHPDLVKIKGPPVALPRSTKSPKLFDIFFTEEEGDASLCHSNHGTINLSQEKPGSGRSVTLTWYHYSVLSVTRIITFSVVTEKNIKRYKKNKNLASLFTLQKQIFSEVLGCDSSVVKMTDSNGKIYYVIKQALIGNGGFSHVKDALVYTAEGEIVDREMVIRSSSEKTPDCVIQLNCDDAMARAQRVRTHGPDLEKNKNYTLLEKGFGSLTAYLQLHHQISFDRHLKDAAWYAAIAVTLLAYRYQVTYELTHGDIKPDNILLFQDKEKTKIERVRLIDTDCVAPNSEEQTQVRTGTKFYLPSNLVSRAAADCFSVSRTLLAENGYQSGDYKVNLLLNDHGIAWIFSTSHMGDNPALKAVLRTTNGKETRYSIREILCAILLAKNNLLTPFFKNQTVSIPAELTRIILEHEDEKSTWSWLENEAVRKLFLEGGDNFKSSLQAQLSKLVDEAEIKLRSSLAPDFSVAVDWPLPRNALSTPGIFSRNGNEKKQDKQGCASFCAVM